MKKLLTIIAILCAPLYLFAKNAVEEHNNFIRQAPPIYIAPNAQPAGLTILYSNRKFSQFPSRRYALEHLINLRPGFRGFFSNNDVFIVRYQNQSLGQISASKLKQQKSTFTVGQNRELTIELKKITLPVLLLRAKSIRKALFTNGEAFQINSTIRNTGTQSGPTSTKKQGFRFTQQPKSTPTTVQIQKPSLPAPKSNSLQNRVQSAPKVTAPTAPSSTLQIKTNVINKPAQPQPTPRFTPTPSPRPSQAPRQIPSVPSNLNTPSSLGAPSAPSTPNIPSTPSVSPSSSFQSSSPAPQPSSPSLPNSPSLDTRREFGSFTQEPPSRSEESLQLQLPQPSSRQESSFDQADFLEDLQNLNPEPSENLDLGSDVEDPIFNISDNEDLLQALELEDLILEEEPEEILREVKPRNTR